jgi:hypothetical protein
MWLEADFRYFYNFIEQPVLGQNRLLPPFSERVDKAFTASQSRCMNNFAFQAMMMGMTTTLCGGGVGL